MDLVRPLKIERKETGGSQDNLYPHELKPSEDAIEARGVVFQNETSSDTAVVITRDSANNMLFRDAANPGNKTLTELLAGGGGGVDDDQIGNVIPPGSTFIVKAFHQHVVYHELQIRGEYIIRGDLVITGGSGGGGSGGGGPHAPTHGDGGSDALRLDDFATPIDSSKLNASTATHGLLPKLTGNASDCLRGDGSWGPALDVSSMQVFDGFDGAGGTIVSTLWTDVPLSGVGKKTSGFAHSIISSSAEVTIIEAGTYRITCEVTTGIFSGTSRTQSGMRLAVDAGAGFAEIPGTRATMYNRTLGSDMNTGSVNRILDFAAGDKVKAQAIRITGSSSVELATGGSRLTLEKLG